MKQAVVLFFLFLALWATASAQDSAATLARILAEKGVISSTELARIESSSPDERLRVLVSLLETRGVLTTADVARISTGAGDQTLTASARIVPAVYTNAVPAPAPAAPQAAPKKGPETASVPPFTSQSKFPVTVYGTVLLNAVYNTALTNIEDIPLIAGKQGSDPFPNDKNYAMTARQSRLGFRYQGPEVMGAKISGQVEVDFFGGKAALGNGVNMDLLRLRLALGRLDWKDFSLVAGQDWSVFAPLNPTSLASYAIPAMSASGNPWIRSPQLRAEWRHALSDSSKFQWQIGATDPNVGDYGTAFLTSRSPLIGERGRMPALDSRLGFTSTVDGHDFAFGVSGHYGRGKNVGTIGPRNVTRTVDSWGAALDWSLPFSKYFAITGEAYEGRALGIFSVASGEGVGAVGTRGEHGVLSRGGWAQAQLNFNPKWQMNAAYGIDQPKTTELPVGNRNRNQTFMTNLMYKFSPNVTFAWEYRRFLTDFRNQLFADERGDHINFAVAYAF